MNKVHQQRSYSLQGKIFTVHSGEPLAQIASDYILSKIDNSTPLALIDVTIWVPSPRAAAAMKDAFISKTGAGLLPQIRMMSFSEDDADVFRFDQDELVAEETVSGLARLMILTKLVSIRDKELSFPLALESAQALAKIFHRLKSYDVTLDEITALVPTEHAHHWEENLDFFKVAFEFYPNWLAEQNKVDAADASKKVVAAQINDYQNKGMANLTFAIGFSDSTPLGISLIKEVITHKNGGLILPGLDQNMADDVWQNIKATHPHYTMKRMLDALDVKRSDVEVLGENKPSARALLWRHALASSDQLSLLPDSVSLPATAGMTFIEAKSASEEAEAIAVCMRQTLETKGKTCALISPDRTLALRVEAALKRWNIDVDDSAGIPLITTSIGGLFKLVANVVQENFRPLLLAELLYHPLVHFGEYEAFYKKRDALDRLVLRGAKPAAGIVGLRRALEQALADPFKNKENADLASEAIDIIEKMFAPLQSKNAKRDISAWMRHHVDVVKNLLHRSEDDDGQAIFDDESGQTLIALLTSWQNAAEDIGTLDFESYTQTLNSVMATSAVRKRHSTHPRLAILGPMESRMQEFDTVIIGAANEGAWPRQVTPDPWLNKVIAEKVGLPSTDIHVGMSAHDFISLACKKDVVLTRTLKDAEGETMPSRFMSRLEAVISPAVYEQMVEKGRVWLSRATALRIQGQFTQAKSPYVQVSKKRRPAIWSASTVRDMMQCPYKTYIKKVLKIDALDAYEDTPTAADKGQIVHLILESFFAPVAKMPAPYAEDMQNQTAIYDHLMVAAKQAFLSIDQKGMKVLWLRKFEKVAIAFAAQIAVDYKNGRHLFDVEKEARVHITPEIELYAKADRIDKVDHKLVIVDYKTGTPPTASDVLSGKEPQMATEAVIAHKGGYQKGASLKGLEYWHVSGAKNNPLDVKNAIGHKVEISTFIEEAETGIKKLAEHYMEQEGVYEAFPGGATAEDKLGPCVFCDYAGICRYKDWVSNV
ncbi:MAG: ATP-dependent helicase/nuclease subunit B [bacterium]